MSQELYVYLWTLTICPAVVLFLNYLRKRAKEKTEVFNTNCLIELALSVVPIVNIVVSALLLINIGTIYMDEYDEI